MIKDRAHNIETALEQKPLYVQADLVRLDQLLSNVLVNACKFTPFAQGERSLARSSGGLGIGLSIARLIAELHGGRIQARSEGPNRGALFELSLPLSEPPAERIAQVPANTAAGPAKRILVVEDNDDIRESLSMVLRSWGHDVVLSRSGDEGVALALAVRPDIALIDIGLPDMDGYEVALHLREQTREWRTGIRMIAMTGYGAPEDRARTADVGFAEHVVKPVDAEVLKPLLRM